jgi:hypothetical protein
MAFTLSKISASRVDGTLHKDIPKRATLSVSYLLSNELQQFRYLPPSHLPPFTGPNSQKSPVICPYSTQTNVPNQNQDPPKRPPKEKPPQTLWSTQPSRLPQFLGHTSLMVDPPPASPLLPAPHGPISNSCHPRL